MFDDETKSAIGKMAAALGLDPALLLAVVAVESGGAVFATVDGRREPLIRFEGHYFDRRLSVDKRRRARSAGLAWPVAGRVANPPGQPERWAMLAKAAAINREAAYESASWGAGQVMGAHWRWLGYASVEELVAEARSGIDGQLRLMLRYMERAALIDALRNRDWKAFARGYNGPAYARQGYHSKLEEAYRRYAPHGAPKPAEDSVATGRTRQDAVRELQRCLSAAGYPVTVDGIIGPATRRAIRRFQKDRGLAVDGVAGPRTWDALRQASPLDRAGDGLWQSVRRWLARLLRRAGWR